MKKLFIICVLCVLSICLFQSQAMAGNKNLQISWNQVMCDDLAGWRLYRSASPGVAAIPANLFTEILYTGTPKESYTATKVLESADGQETTHYFVMTAYDTDGNESLPSLEVGVLIDFDDPDSPYSITITVSPAQK